MPTDTATSLPDLQVSDGTTYTVTCDDPAAVITQLVMHGNQEAGPDLLPPEPGGTYLLPSLA